MPDIKRKISEKIFADLPIISPNHEGFTITPDLIDTILADLLKDNDIRNKIWKIELKEEIRLFLLSIGISGNLTYDAIYGKTSEFIDYLKQTIEYRAIFIIPGVFGLPIGTRFGNFTIVNPSTDEAIKDQIIFRLNHLERFYDKFGWGEIKFTTYRTARLDEVLIKELERPLSLVSLLMN